MTEEKPSSNLDNDSEDKLQSTNKNSEDKNSSISDEKAGPSVLEDDKTEKAVEDITRQEGDELLALHTATKPLKLHKKWYDIFKKKKISIPLALVILIAIVLAIPAGRYKALGLFLKEKYSIAITDSQTGKPVSDATVTLSGLSATSNSQGQVNLNPKVGYATISISKKYYKTVTEKVLVPIHQKTPLKLKLQATGRQVPLKVVNLITGKPVNNAKITADGTTATTDSQGQVTMVLPADQKSVKASISAAGYNDSARTVTITTNSVPSNTIPLTPGGRIYFLSNLSGNIDVVSTNLDGSGRQTVLAGTGNEDPNNTVLLATRDWKYLALLSKRDGGNDAKLFLINTATKQLTTIDNGSASFSPVGWSGHNFVYQTTLNSVPLWKSGNTKIKSYNADKGQLVTIDQNTSYGGQDMYDDERINFVNLVGDDRIVYGMAWDGFNESIAGKKDSIKSAKTDGTDKSDLRDIPTGASSYFNYMTAILYRPETLYIQLSGNSNSTYYTYDYENNSVSQSNTITDQSFSQSEQNYYTYLESPSGNQTFWSEQRDGKNTLFVGDYYADNGQQIATLSDYIPYGWYTDNYLLAEKNGSELYIMPKGSTTQAIKISDYYKPPHNYYGYGGGYGGL